MRKKSVLLAHLFLLFFLTNAYGQSFSVNLEHTELSGSVGKDLAYHIDITNT